MSYPVHKLSAGMSTTAPQILNGRCILVARGLLQAAQILNQNRMAQRISFLFEKTKSLFVSADNFGPVTMLSFPLRHSLHAEANWLLFKCCLIHHYVKRLSSSVGSHIFFLTFLAKFRWGRDVVNNTKYYLERPLLYKQRENLHKTKIKIQIILKLSRW
jgi:hypothetical protein